MNKIEKWFWTNIQICYETEEPDLAMILRGFILSIPLLLIEIIYYLGSLNQPKKEEKEEEDVFSDD